MKKKPDNSDAELLTKEEFKKKYPNMDYLVYLNTNGRWIVLDSPHNHLTYVSKLGHEIKVGPGLREILNGMPDDEKEEYSKKFHDFLLKAKPYSKEELSKTPTPLNPRSGEPEIRYIGGTDPYMADGNLHDTTIMRYEMTDEDFAQFEKSSIKWAIKESQNKLEFQDMVQQVLKYYENVKLFPKPITLTDLLKRFGGRLSVEEKEKLKSICNNQQE